MAGVVNGLMFWFLPKIQLLTQRPVSLNVIEETNAGHLKAGLKVGHFCLSLIHDVIVEVVSNGQVRVEVKCELVFQRSPHQPVMQRSTLLRAVIHIEKNHR